LPVEHRVARVDGVRREDDAAVAQPHPTTMSDAEK
jgi:hypothetical protein